jgi:hypothetical protein
VIEAAPRRRTGTPEVGVPAVSGQIEAAGRRKRPSTGGNSGALSTESSVWFEDGERASEEADKIRRRKAPIVTPSSTDLSLYDEPIQRRRWPIVVGALGVVGVVAAALAFGMKSDKPTTKPAAAEPVATTPAITPVPDVPPSQILDQGSAATAQKPAEVATKPAVKETKTKSSSSKSSSTGFGTPPPKVKATKPDTTDDAAARRPTGGGWFDSGGSTTTTTPPANNNTPTTTIITPTPTNPTPSGVSGSEGPLDPYGAGGTDSSTTSSPTDSASPDKKAEFFAQVGQQQLVSGDTTGAAASFKKALELDPKNIVSVIGMGDIALRQGLFGDAISHLKKAAKLAPRSSRVFTLLGEAYLNSGNNAVAADNFKKALQLDPENTRARDGYNEASSKVPPPEDE